MTKASVLKGNLGWKVLISDLYNEKSRMLNNLKQQFKELLASVKCQEHDIAEAVAGNMKS